MTCTAKADHNTTTTKTNKLPHAIAVEDEKYLFTIRYQVLEKNSSVSQHDQAWQYGNAKHRQIYGAGPTSDCQKQIVTHSIPPK